MAEPDRGARGRQAQGQRIGAAPGASASASAGASAGAGASTGAGAGAGAGASAGAGADGAAGAQSASLRTHPPPQGMMYPQRMGPPVGGFHHQHPPPPPPPPAAFFPGSASLFEQLDKRVMVGAGLAWLYRIRGFRRFMCTPRTIACTLRSVLSIAPASFLFLCIFPFHFFLSRLVYTSSEGRDVAAWKGSNPCGVMTEHANSTQEGAGTRPQVPARETYLVPQRE